ncbi:hypothetical protein [Pseudoalteromonas sp. PAMC 22718]|uniref:hypothetical protein n=1 Tax=Pseudoalteromonas sp. PAMC 22718 TaxID=1175295 RepID=UPI0002DF552C|nr:hypothetical protein [Pseudoalteromonas sp. PAMC 22718]
MDIIKNIGYKQFLASAYFFSENENFFLNNSSIKSIANSFGIDRYSCKAALKKLEAESLLNINTIYTQSRGGIRKEFIKNEALTQSFLGCIFSGGESFFIKDILNVRRDKMLSNLQRALILIMKYLEYTKYHTRIITVKELAQFLNITESRVVAGIQKLNGEMLNSTWGGSRVIGSYKAIYLSSKLTWNFKLGEKNTGDTATIYLKSWRYSINILANFEEKLRQTFKNLKIRKEELLKENLSLTDKQKIGFEENIESRFYKEVGGSNLVHFLTFENAKKIFLVLESIKANQGTGYYINEGIGRCLSGVMVENKLFFETYSTEMEKGMRLDSAQLIGESETVLFFGMLNHMFSDIVKSIKNDVMYILHKKYQSEEIYFTSHNPLHMKGEPNVFLAYGEVEAQEILLKKKPFSTSKLLGFNLWKDKNRSQLIGTLLIKFY